MSRAIQFGLGGLTAQATTHDRAGYGVALRHLVDLAVTAEASGFDGAWTSEHHFVDDGYLPSPLLPLTAIAERTSRITIGTQVMLAPLYSPVKLAEDTAVLDQLSGGRLCLGIGLGYQGKEYKAFGTTATKRVAALERCVQVLRQSWRGEPVDIGDGEHVSVRPLPRQDPGPSILLGAIAEAGVRRSARIADGFVAPMMSLGGYRRRAEWLLDEGVGNHFAFGIYLHAFVATNDAWPRARDGIAYVESQYSTWQQAHQDFDQFRTVDRGTLEEPPAHVIIGSPEQVIEQLAPWTELLRSMPGDGARHIIVRLTYPGLEAAAAHEVVSLFGSDVIPAFTANGVEAGARA
jgi:alkanesulfonate monooxygenase SsuD/methylene tetrahydromethanopterin reductase-like flavin-dependent oxidoreductase (luciferase family)